MPAPYNEDDEGAFDLPPPLPEVWPANLWIALGVLVYGGSPALYVTWAGIVYFMVGGVFAFVFLGNLTARFNQMIGPALKDLFPGDAVTGRWLAVAARGLVLGMEGMMVLHLGRITIVLLSGGALTEIVE